MSIDKRLISTGAAAVCTADTLDIFGDSSCIALYGLNYDASDTGGNYDGTATDVTFNAPGYIDYAADFNGTSSKINTGYIQNGQVFSCSFWGKDFSAYGSILRDTPSGGGTNTRIDISAGGASIPYAVFYGSGSAVYLGTTGSTPVGWHHYVITADGSTAKLYMDGVEEASISYTQVGGNNSTPVHMMTNGAAASGYNSGKLDQVRIFNKALSASEVTTLYGETACEYTCTTDTNGFPSSASSDLVAYYKFDSDATDETGSYNGTATNVTFGGGRYGAGADFNGSSSYIQTNMTYNTIVDVNDKTQDFSFSLWMYQRSQDTVNVANIFTINEYAPSYQYVGLNISTSGDIRFVQYPGGASGVSASTPTTLNQWIHVVCVRENSSLKIYKDGTLEDTVAHTISNNSLDSTIKWVFGARLDGGNDLYFDGKIDQVRIYNSALSSTEVSSLYEDEHQCYITVDSTDPFGDSNNIALYELENNANDSNGSYNGTASNITYSTDSIIGTYAAVFNGTNSRIINTASGIGSLSDTSISLSCWFKFTASISDRIYMVAIEGNSFEHYIGLHLDINKCGISIQRGGGTQDSRISANDMNDGKWHHLVLTRSSTTFSDFKAYLDGSIMPESATSNKGAGTGITFNKISMGYNDRKTSSYYNGDLDQVRIFNRALNGDEVWKLYAEGAKG